MRRLRAQEVELAELRRLDVVVPAELLAAHAAQPRIRWRGDAERVVIRRRDELIVQRLEAAVPSPEIGDREAHVRPELLLDRDVALPVVGFQVVASDRVACKTRVAANDLTERAVTPRSALAVSQRVSEIAVWDEIARAWITRTEEGVVPSDRRARGLVGNREVHGNAGIALRIPA